MRSKTQKTQNQTKPTKSEPPSNENSNENKKRMICLDGHVDLFLIFVEGSFGFQQSCPAADRGVRNKKNGAAHVSEEQLSGKSVKGAAIGLGSLWGSRKWHGQAAVRALGCVQPLGKRQEKRLFSMSRLLGFMAWFQGISWRQRK